MGGRGTAAVAVSIVTVLALGSRAYRQLSARYQDGAELPLAAEPVPCPA